MIENVSPIYEYVSIRDWADQIRKMKINELKESINIYEKILEQEAKNYADPERYKKIVISEIDKIKEKLNYLIPST